MKSILLRYGLGRPTVQAIQAGCDMVLGVLDIPHSLAAVRKAVKAGELKEEDIDASVTRILAAKLRLGLIEDPDFRPERPRGGPDVRRSLALYRDRADCSGCGACHGVCPMSGPGHPQEAIVMTPDEEGFLYPRIDPAVCIRCGACAKVCAFQAAILSQGGTSHGTEQTD